MPAPAKWDWSIGNVNATVAQTQAAYQALTTPSNVGHGPTRNFSVIVWNDIVNKIIEMRQYWGDTEWSISAPCTKSQTWMIPGEWMTADIFNSAVINMPPIHPWGWEATLGRKDVHKRDVCFGYYFLYLVDGFNHWVDLSPRYVRPPNPFNIHVSMANDTVVRRALHIMSDPRFYWHHTVRPRIDPSIHIKSRLYVHLVPRLHLPLFHTAHVGIIIIFNTKIKNKVFVGDAAHIIADLNVSSTVQGKITFGDIMFLLGAIDGTTSAVATLRTPASVPILMDNLVELTGPTGEIIAVTPSGISADITGTFTGEAWVREPDSLNFKEDLQITQTGSLRFTFADIQPLLMNLEGVFAPTVDISVLPSDSFVAQLAATWTPHMKFSTPDTAVMEGSIIGESLFRATMQRLRRTVLPAVHIPVSLSTSALVAFAADEIPTGADLSGAFSASATVAFAADEVSTGGHLSGTSGMSATVVFAADEVSTGAHLYDVTTMSATVAFAAREVSTGANLSDASSMSATLATNATPLYVSAALSDTTDIAATVDLEGDFFAEIKGGCTIQHTGEGTVHLDSVVESAGGIDAEFDGTLTVDFADVTWVRAHATFTYTASVTFDAQKLTLASEIDNELASDLDNTLVSDVEFHY